MNHHLRFRQIHLDFHTSGMIPGIGQAFDKAEFQQTLKDAHVNSITLFAKCHHGWHYNETKVGYMHPQLEFDLLRAQYEACREIDINAPIYISAGYDNVMLDEHPEWSWIMPDDADGGRWMKMQSTLFPHFRGICFNSPYLEHLADETREVLQQFPDCNGLFFDIIHAWPCCCPYCQKMMRDNGLDPSNPHDREIATQKTLERYYSVITNAVMEVNSDMPVFHNSGHVAPGQRDRLNEYFSHLELESLPTGGWGYDHFPLSAKYVQTLDLDYLGMTGKFHTTWGEFGGYKHPNALRYECGAMLAYGAKCSIGDQLHPDGALDKSTYRIIGQAYAEVEAKEPWCDNVCNIAEIAVLLKAGVEKCNSREVPGDIGAGRVLLEGHFLFDMIDMSADFSNYKLIILPDSIKVTAPLKKKLDNYLNKGGRLLLTGTSGLDDDGKFLFDVGAKCEGPSPYQPDYMLPTEALQPADIDSPMVMYLRSQRIKPAQGGKALGKIYDSYFNRKNYQYFCSHQHTPYQPDESGYVSGVYKGNITYIAHPIFSIYRGWGSVPLGQYIRKVVTFALGGETMISTNMPSSGRVTLMRQKGRRRDVLHLLYASIISRGGSNEIDGVPVRGNGLVIEDLLPLNNIEVKLNNGKQVKSVTLQPQGVPVPFETASDGSISFRIESFTCHQMVVIGY